MLLRVKDIKVSYGKVEVVKGVSLEMDEGDIVTLLGANGAGKTTVLKVISGLKHLTSGEIWFSNQRIDGILPSKIVVMGIGHVPEGRRLFPSLSVEDNLMLGAYARKDKIRISQDLDEVYMRFPILNTRKKQRASSMSGGEQQMLAIGRALMGRPRLLLMDEPSIGLSPIMVEEIASIISSIHVQGISVLIVEQNAAIALGLANRGYVLETGQIVISGNSEDLFKNDRVKSAYLGG